jgi:hypothetical protein
MSLIGPASKCSLTTSSLTALCHGTVGASVAQKLGLTSSSLQQFINGGTSIGLAAVMGITSASLQELRNTIGKQGAIGLIIGLIYDRT